MTLAHAGGEGWRAATSSRELTHVGVVLTNGLAGAVCIAGNGVMVSGPCSSLAGPMGLTTPPVDWIWLSP